MKKAVADMWMVIIWAIVGLIIAGIVIYIVRGGLFTGSENVDSLSSCRQRGGMCKASCDDAQETSFYRIGCPYDANRNGKIDDAEKGDYCCIKSST